MRTTPVIAIVVTIVTAPIALSLALATSLVTIPLLVRHGWWLVVPAALAVISWMSYRAALVAATNYGIAVHAAFDVYHLRLLDQIGIKRPVNTEDERLVQRDLLQLIRENGDASVSYAEHPTPENAGETVQQQQQN